MKGDLCGECRFWKEEACSKKIVLKYEDEICKAFGPIPLEPEELDERKSQISEIFGNLRECLDIYKKKKGLL